MKSREQPSACKQRVHLGIVAVSFSIRITSTSTKSHCIAFRARTTTYANRACLRQFLRESMILCDLRNRAWKRGSELNPALGMGRMFSLRSTGSSLPPASAGGKKEPNLPSSRLQPDFPALLQHFAPPSTLLRMNPPSRSPAEAGSSIRPNAIPTSQGWGQGRACSKQAEKFSWPDAFFQDAPQNWLGGPFGLRLCRSRLVLVLVLVIELQK